MSFVKKIFLVGVLAFYSFGCMQPLHSNFDIKNSGNFNFLGLLTLGYLNNQSSFLQLKNFSISNNAARVGIFTPLVFEFSTEPDTATCSQGILFKDSGGTNLGFNCQSSGNQLEIVPTQNLGFDQKYSLTLVSGANGLLGKNRSTLEADLSFSFTTTAWGFYIAGDNGLNAETLSSNRYFPHGVVHNGSPFVTFSEVDGSNYARSYLRQYDLATGWSLSPSTTYSMATGHDDSYHTRVYSIGGEIYLAWIERKSSPDLTYNFYVKKWVNGSFVQLGNSRLNQIPAGAIYPTIIEFQSELYAIWSEEYINKFFIKKFNTGTNNWDLKGVIDTSGPPYPRPIVFKEKLYIATQENDGNSGYSLHFYRFDGTNLVKILGNIQISPSPYVNSDYSSPFADKYYISPSMAVLGDRLYVAWSEHNGTVRKVQVKVYNGDDSNPVFTSVGGTGLNYDSTKNADAPYFLTYRNKLFIAWSEVDSSSIRQIRLAYYNGNDSSPAWTFADGITISANGLNKSNGRSAMNPVLFGTENLYMTWSEINSSSNNGVQVLWTPY